MEVLDDLWARLSAPFPRDALTWRVVRLSEAGTEAQVRPQLRAAAVVARLDEVATVGGWSNTFAPIGEHALSCALTIAGVTKSLVVPLEKEAAACADEALVAAAERFGMRPPLPAESLYWIDYDAETGEMLYEPELEPAPAAVTPAPAGAPKPAGQQAIDRLLERLKTEGLGLEAAKLLVAYGGYGGNPTAARELYAKLRALLLERPTANHMRARR